MIYRGLRNVLLAYSNHDQSISLENRQMGSVIATIVYHCRGDEVSTFWILVSLIENYDMRKFYQKGLPGIPLYGEILFSLIENHLPEVSQIFKKHKITYFDFLENWIEDLFTSYVPMSLMGELMSMFLKDGWAFFLRMCLTLLSSL